jgi:hypothetical protein
MLRSEVNSNLVPGHSTILISHRFAVYLSVYVARCGHYRDSLRQQIQLNEQLTNITVAIKSISILKRSEFESSQKSVFARECLTKLLPNLPEKFCLSVCPKIQCSSINIAKCFVLSSKKMPLWVQFINADGMGIEYPIIFKVGDDLRQDQLTLQLIKLMDSLWRGEFDMGDQVDDQTGSVATVRTSSSSHPKSYSGGIQTQASKVTRLKFMSMSMFSTTKSVNADVPSEADSASVNKEPVLDLRMKSYGCCSTALDSGFIEVVVSSQTCANIQTQYGGKITGAWSNNTIVDYLKSANYSTADYELAVDNFARTCAGTNTLTFACPSVYSSILQGTAWQPTC